MNIGTTGAASAAVQATPSSDDKRLQLQTMLLRKTLDMQLKQSAELSNQLEGKGQMLDIRV